MATNRAKLNEVYGDPFKERTKLNSNIKKFEAQKLFPWFPVKLIYCNKDLVDPLINTLTLLEAAGLHTEIKTFDGCFNIRMIRGSKDMLSIHSWALAVDFNAKDNPLGHTRQQALDKGLTPFTEGFIKVWEDTGWVCGARFKRGDGMHMQFTKQFDS